MPKYCYNLNTGLTNMLTESENFTREMILQLISQKILENLGREKSEGRVNGICKSTELHNQGFKGNY